jgi:hypothetical protein
MTIDWLSYDYWLTIIWLLTDYHMTIDWLSYDYWLTIIWLLTDYHMTIDWLSYDYWLTIIIIWLLIDYQLTFIWLLIDYQLTFIWLLIDYHMTIDWLPVDFHMTTNWLAKQIDVHKVIDYKLTASWLAFWTTIDCLQMSTGMIDYKCVQVEVTGIWLTTSWLQCDRNLNWQQVDFMVGHRYYYQVDWLHVVYNLLQVDFIK